MRSAKDHLSIPEQLNANQPIELAGGRRDGVKLMVLDRNSKTSYHEPFVHIERYLGPGDVLVFNNSRTIPAVLKGKQGNRDIEVRLSRKIDGQKWEALVVDGLYSSRDLLLFPGNVTAEVIGKGIEGPLVILSFSLYGYELLDFIYKYGEPIRYEYIKDSLPLNDYQTVYSSVPGSVEMPSAGRAFTWDLLNSLQKRGIKLAFVQLHTGLSYYGNDQWPNPTMHPEYYHVSMEAATIINQAKKSGKRVIAVGTTVVRTLETVANEEGSIQSEEGITSTYIHKHTKLKLVDGLLTGLHEPEASHLDMLGAFINQDQLIRAYQEAINNGYLWHEFGDVNLILPVK
ncbi:S-adenosylmethionine:tRNA ribosyltransferase-isomerase [Bacillus pinisoli]|uniref:S-adenosylmethionine:tRNA ribosyltransferase-isomerase n=1 Tax=Bacillus pinisoli TaxID=2901866 RepID=UPI001FF17A67|nr:S-adenosylmethionine:tRNA ribosyltransferase-isomerase [Bacillus pinisoli]